MKLVVAPEPAPWVRPLLDTLAGPVTLMAPWAIPPGWRVPERLLRRVAPKTTHLETIAPLWVPLEHGLKRLIDPIGARLRLRQWLDVLVAPQVRGELETVYAPSLSALRTFAAAKARGVETVLVDDTPSLRALHADLDRAADALPQLGFLRNYRAPVSMVVQQEQEWVLASRALTTGLRAAKRLPLASSALPLPKPERIGSYDATARVVRFAGTTASRYGFELAQQSIPEGMELVTRHAAAGRALKLAAVIAPAWVECQLPELVAAAEANIPVIATNRAMGWLRPGPLVHEIAVGDGRALRRAVERVLRGTPPPGHDGTAQTLR